MTHYSGNIENFHQVLTPFDYYDITWLMLKTFRKHHSLPCSQKSISKNKNKKEKNVWNVELMWNLKCENKQIAYVKHVNAYKGIVYYYLPKKSTCIVNLKGPQI